jgi:hypothetical protein
MTEVIAGSEFELTVFRKRNGILSKRISLTEAGRIKADGSACRMTSGQARRVKLNGVDSLADLIECMSSDAALALGRLRGGLPDEVHIVRKEDLEDAMPPGTVARTKDHIVFAPGEPAYLLLDHDRKGMPTEIKDKLKAAGGFWGAVTSVVPALASAARVERGSTSSGLSHKKTGKQFNTSPNRHVYVAVADGADIERALKTLQDRLWLAGFGYVVVGAAGQILIRSIIDASVYGPERLVFEGGAAVAPPLVQDKEARRPRAYEGDIIDTSLAIPALTEQEARRLAERQAEAAHCAEPLVAAARKAWAADFAARRGLSEQEAERIASQALKCVLETEFELEFDDPDLGTCTVAEVIADPRRFVGETLADPLEGRAYGRGKAKVLRRRNRCLMIHSFAHGGIKYQLAGQGVRLEDFRAYKPQHTYFFTPTREPWPAVSVNATLPPVPLLDDAGNPVLDAKGNPRLIPASHWLDEHRSVEQITWAPGKAMDVEDRLVSDGGWVTRNGVTCLNLYLPPAIEQGGDPDKADPWLEHVCEVYPHDAEHIVSWLAHRVQHPDQKINHALALGGAQGIGKDTLLEPLKYAVGPWNFKEASPKQVMGRFNSFLKAVILRINEARDLGEYDRYAFYDHMKAYTAAPPDVLRVDEKHLREYAVFNVCGVIITTNHKTDGIYLDADDRRHYVAWSDLTKERFSKYYWNRIWRWYAKGGKRHVAAYLDELDISDFDAKAPPPKTAAFYAIADVGRAPEEAEMADVLDRMGKPEAVTLAMLVDESKGGDFRDWLTDRKNRRVIPHRFEGCGYVQVRNDAAKDGYFVVDGERRAIYARADLTMRQRLRAARDLVDGGTRFGR